MIDPRVMSLLKLSEADPQSLVSSFLLSKQNKQALSILLSKCDEGIANEEESGRLVALLIWGSRGVDSGRMLQILEELIDVFESTFSRCSPLVSKSIVTSILCVQLNFPSDFQCEKVLSRTRFLYSQLGAPKNLAEHKLLVPNPVGSNVIHYNHFFGAVLLPVLDSVSLSIINDRDRYLLEFCGPLFSEIKEVCETFSVNIEQASYLCFDIVRLLTSELNAADRFIQLAAYDYYWLAGYEPPRSLISRVKRLLHNALGLSNQYGKTEKSNKEVIIVDRKPAGDFYLEQGRTTGADRRSIPNAKEIVSVLNESGVTAEIVYFEEKLLMDKLRLLHRVKLILMQHGAALTACNWLTSGTTLIEVLPAGTVRPNLGIYDFSVAGKVIAEENGLNYVRYSTKTEHELLSADRIKSICTRLLSSESEGL